MCYINIKPAEPLKRKYYWKIVKVVIENGIELYRSIYVTTLLPTNQWIEAKNVYNGFHSHVNGFKGFGVFSGERVAERYLKAICRQHDPDHKIIKVLGRGNHRKARTKKVWLGGRPPVTCYIFDKIKIIDECSP